VYLVDDVTRLTEHRSDLIEYPLRIGSDDDIGHEPNLPATTTTIHGQAPKPGGRVLDIQVDLDRGCTICRPVGELDAFTVSQFRQTLAELASSPQLLIDLSGVPFVDSAGLGALIGGIRRVRELGGEVAVACPRPTLTRLLRTTGFDRIVTVTATLDEAIATLGAPAGDDQAPADHS